MPVQYVLSRARESPSVESVSQTGREQNIDMEKQLTVPEGIDVAQYH